MFEFDNNTTRFSLLNAFRLAEASEFVYNPSWDEVEKKIIQGWGFTSFKPFERNDTEAFICGNETMLILAFRGTQTLEDWQTDFKVQLVESSVGRVHGGFTESLDNIWQEIKQSIGTVRFFDCQGVLRKDNVFWKSWLSSSESAAARSLDRFSELKSQYPNGIDDHSLNRYLANIRKNYVKERGVKTYKDYLAGM